MASSLPRLSHKSAIARGEPEPRPKPRFLPPASSWRIHFSRNRQRRLWMRMLMISVAGVFFFCWLTSREYVRSTDASSIVSKLEMDILRIANVLPAAMQGRPEAAAVLTRSSRAFSDDLKLLQAGGVYLGADIESDDSGHATLDAVVELWQGIDQAIDALLKLQHELSLAVPALQRLERILPEMLEVGGRPSLPSPRAGVSVEIVQVAASLLEVERGLNALLSTSQVASDGLVAPSSNDMASNAASRLSTGLGEPSDRHTRLMHLFRLFAPSFPDVADLPVHVQTLVSARQAALAGQVQVEPLLQRLATLQRHYRRGASARHWPFWGMLAAMAGTVLIGLAPMVSGWRRRSVERGFGKDRESIAAVPVSCGAATCDRVVHGSGHEGVSAVVSLVGCESFMQLGRITSALMDGAAHMRDAAVGAAGAARVQSRRVREAAQAIQRVIIRLNGIIGMAGKGAGMVSQSTILASRGTQAMAEMSQVMHGIHGQLQDETVRLERLGDLSRTILDAIEIVAGIGEHIEVLALNLIIQTASAEDGKNGLALMAEEMLVQARRSCSLMSEVTPLLRQIQPGMQGTNTAIEACIARVRDGVVLTDTANAAFGQMRKVVVRQNELMRDLSQATEGQAAATQGVMRQLQDILSGSELVEHSREQVRMRYHELKEALVHLENSVARLSVMSS